MAIAIRGRIEVLSKAGFELKVFLDFWKPINENEDKCMRGDEEIEEVRLTLRSA